MLNRIFYVLADASQWSGCASRRSTAHLLHLWDWDGTRAFIHHGHLCGGTRPGRLREAAIGGDVFDSPSAKGPAPSRRGALDPQGSMRARRSPQAPHPRRYTRLLLSVIEHADASGRRRPQAVLRTARRSFRLGEDGIFADGGYQGPSHCERATTGRGARCHRFALLSGPWSATAWISDQASPGLRAARTVGCRPSRQIRQVRVTPQPLVDESQVLGSVLEPSRKFLAGCFVCVPIVKRAPVSWRGKNPGCRPLY